MIYTSYFAKLKKLPENCIPISICGKAPSWYTGKQYKKLAPKYDFFMKWKQTHDNDFYIKCFKEQVLDNLSVDNVTTELYDGLTTDNDIVLLCYEKPTDFCHRHLVADWFNQNGITVKELEI